MKKIFITGGTGFVGSALISNLLQENCEIYVLTRNSEKVKKLPFSCKIVSGNPTLKGDWQKFLKEMDVVINLAGQNIFSRWTEGYKNKILESRIKSTQNIVSSLKEGTLLLNASAVGYYGDKGDELVTEESPPGNDFLAKVCILWEKEALKAKERNVKVIIARFGIILGKGGMLAKILPFFKLGLGGTLGKGNQWVPWIHIKDLISAINFLIKKGKEGIYNFTSPNPVTNKEFTKTLGKILKRPTILPVPLFMLRLIFGELSNVIISSIKAYPQNLLSIGFSFKFETIEYALRDLLEKSI